MYDLIKGHFYRVKTIEELEREGYTRRLSGSYNTGCGFTTGMQKFCGYIALATSSYTLNINGQDMCYGWSTDECVYLGPNIDVVKEQTPTMNYKQRKFLEEMKT